MPLYSFAIFDGTGPPTTVFADIAEYAMARHEATTLAGDLLKDADPGFWTHGDMRVVLRDDAGAVLCSLMISGIEPGAVNVH